MYCEVRKMVAKSSVVKAQDWVAVDYTGSFDNGNVFDTSEGKGPLKFKTGAGMVIKGFDDALIGMKPGEEKIIKIPAKEGYGERNTQVQELPLSAFEDKSVLKEGTEIDTMSNFGPLLINIVNVEKDKVKVILNHPLAGKDLTFKLKLNKILTGKEAEKLEKEMFTDCSCGCGHDEECSCDEDKCC